MNSEVKLVISGLVYNQTVVGTYGLVLSEETGNRRFSVLIGEPEAQSIALKINNKKSPRPLTHDLIKNILTAFDSELVKVLIYDMINDVFFSELHIMQGDKLLIVDARTSDAVALAVRSNCSIYIKSEILNIVGTEIEVVNEKPTDSPVTDSNKELTSKELDIMTLEELQDLLQQILDDEKYEYAVKIRDAIARKK